MGYGREEKNDLINEIKEEILQLDVFENIQLAILFGSRAREEQDKKSDLDLAFLLKPRFFEKINLIFCRKFNFSVEIVI